MTDTLVNLIQSLHEKATQLKTQKVEYISIISNLKNKIEDYKNQLEKTCDENKKLHEKYNHQVLKNAFETTTEDTTEAKLQIITIIKEIENCIKLLSR